MEFNLHLFGEIPQDLVSLFEFQVDYNKVFWHPKKGTLRYSFMFLPVEVPSLRNIHHLVLILSTFYSSLSHCPVPRLAHSSV